MVKRLLVVVSAIMVAATIICGCTSINGSQKRQLHMKGLLRCRSL